MCFSAFGGGGFDASAVIENRRGILLLLSSPGSTLWFCSVHNGMPLCAIFTGQRLLTALVGPQRDASFGYLCWSLPLVAWVDPQWDASFGYLHWVLPLRARWVRAWALPLSTPLNHNPLVFSRGLGCLYVFALKCYSSMLFENNLPLKPCPWGDLALVLGIGDSRMISPSAWS